MTQSIHLVLSLALGLSALLAPSRTNSASSGVTLVQYGSMVKQTALIMLRSLIEQPSRDRMLAVLEGELLPSVARAKAVTEEAARRPMGFDVVGEVGSLVERWKNEPLVCLVAQGQLLIWLWMDQDHQFRTLMLGDDRALIPWWKAARDMAKSRAESGLVDWPAYALHPTQGLYDPRCCPVEDLYGLLVSLYVLHCS